jgi:hypothetical protein
MTKRLLFAVAGIAIVMFGCSPPDSFDPPAAASRKIQDQIYKELQLDATVTCTPPRDKQVGTKFRCTAKANDGTTYNFNATILAGLDVDTALQI